jgi:2-keto-4-pentenoate hydratase/2-oxohepta-3-ene-1,7-dioic acid hydratase in catechol pathway
MKLVQYSTRDRSASPRMGVLVNDQVVDGADILDGKLAFASTAEFMSSNETAQEELSQAVRKKSESRAREIGKPLSQVKILPPVTPQKIYCIAMNYKSHIEEVRSKMPGFPTPSRPIFFTKLPNALIGHGDPILVPKMSTKVDYEVELAVIIGKKGKYIKSSDATNFIGGYSVVNDVSFRDWQFPPQEMRAVFGQDWVRGKGLDNSCPVGPYLVTKDEVTDSQNLGISLYLNGEMRQEGNTSDMLFDVAKQIEWLSDGITLQPGDIICTGSCTHLAGDKFLKQGDEVVAKVEKVGELKNPVIQEST